jgi:hypothetical protein
MAHAQQKYWALFDKRAIGKKYYFLNGCISVTY